MTVYEAGHYIKKFIGNSGDLKPTFDLTSTGTAIPIGSEFFEINTSHHFIFNGTSWVQVYSIVTTS